MNDDNCPACGSSASDREGYRTRNKEPTISLDLKRCPHCGSFKCCMCDMGNDVECLSCTDDVGDIE